MTRGFCLPRTDRRGHSRSPERPKQPEQSTEEGEKHTERHTYRDGEKKKPRTAAGDLRRPRRRASGSSSPRRVRQQPPPPPRPRPPLPCPKQRARGRGRAVGGGGGEGEGERVAVLRQLRRVHQVGHAAVPVHGRGARRVPPGVPGLREVRPRRAPARVPVHGPSPQLLPAALQRHRRPLTGRPNRPTTPTATGDGRILAASPPEMPDSQPPFFCC